MVHCNPTLDRYIQYLKDANKVRRPLHYLVGDPNKDAKRVAQSKAELKALMSILPPSVPPSPRPLNKDQIWGR